MRLLEAIVQANQRAAAGDAKAGLHPGEFADALPLAALTCIDARLNAMLPGVLGVPEEKFIWLRNAGTIITGPMSSTMRSLALACAVKGAKEIIVLGHTDCLVCKTPMVTLLDRFQSLGVDRTKLPDDIVGYFGLFASERQNVMRGAGFIRQSPLIGPKIPVHGLLVDIHSGRLEWIVNGYQTLEAQTSGTPAVETSAIASPDRMAMPEPPPLQVQPPELPRPRLRPDRPRVGNVRIFPPPEGR
jgi:carbonic anhydrase